MGDLLPCPWCGETKIEPVDKTRILGMWNIIHCCPVIGPFKIELSTREAVIYIWNTRALPSATQAGGWMPPEDRENGYRCLGFETLWSTVEWREGYWLALTENDDRLLVAPTAFAPLPPAPEGEG